MNIEIGLLILFILLVIYCFYQKTQEKFVTGNIYSNLKNDPEKINTIRTFFENLTINNDKYYLFGKEFNCIISDTNIIDEDAVIV